MKIKIENCILKTEPNNWIVQSYGDTLKKDGTMNYQVQQTSYPATLQQALRCMVVQTVKKENIENLEELMAVLLRIEKSIKEVEIK